jgi:hypothetical protein
VTPGIGSDAPSVRRRRRARSVVLLALSALGPLVLVLVVAVYVGHRVVSSIEMPDLFSAINETDRPEPPLAPPPITLEEARGALMRMVKPEEAALIEKVKERTDPNGEVSLGPWRCNLRAKTFHAQFDLGSAMAFYGGEFTRDPSGVWRATIKNTQLPLKSPRRSLSP